MPSDKHNSRTARARDLISSLINITSSRDVPFHQPQLLQCLHHGVTLVHLWSPILSSQPRKVTFCIRHVMASVQDKDSWGTSLYISVNGFWGGNCERTFLDVKVFNPYASSNRSTTLRGIYRRHENAKKRTCEARIRKVEHATFTALVFSAKGGMADEACNFYKCISPLLCDKWSETYTSVIVCLRCCLSFSLLRSAIRITFFLWNFFFDLSWPAGTGLNWTCFFGYII